MLGMDPAGSIGKLGFRRWYERQLYASHGWLVACLFSGFGMFALLEDLTWNAFGAHAAVILILAFVAGGIAWYALVRYLGMLLRAQRLAERSTCTGCGAYGQYRLVGATPNFMTVSCRKCAHEWRIG
jgi:polyferredoxin